MALRRQPLVAITCALEPGETPRSSLPLRYAEAVLRAGGLPLQLVPTGGPADVERLLERVDALLLSGGDDFDTARLGLGPTHPAARPVPSQKQDMDFELARCALERGLPVLGICYGMQLLALSEGGRLLQHLPDDRPNAQQHSGSVQHGVHLRAGSKLAQAFGVSELSVLSSHHQAIGAIGPRWSASALDAEGLIEGIEREDHPFALGVQWHPECAPTGDPNERIFRALVSAASLCEARR
jgi:putative glutamine amidotransferase